MKKPTPTRPTPVRGRRRVVRTSSRDWVDVRPLDPAHPYPTLVEPRLPGLSLAAWGRENRDWIEELWREKRALLFRGFDLDGIPGFEVFVDAASRGERLAYRDRSTPREAHGDRIYCTTIHPADQAIRLHNEGSYWRAWSMKAFFACITPPATGGATPIGDVHRVYLRIAPEVREEFERRGVTYVRNYNDGFSLPWQEVFQTNEPAEVEAYCRANSIHVEWKPGGRLRTRAVRPAVRRHPRTGEPLWFNHAAFFNAAALEPGMRAALLDHLGEEDLPYQTYFGDGAPIPAELVQHVLACYDAETIRFDWRAGDVHLIDNMRLAHAREPYTGERLILVALTEAYAPDDGKE